MTKLFPPTRTAGLERLTHFVPKSARDYATRRNYDLPQKGHPHVSQLSPYLRHRLITETEVLQAVLGRYSLSSAEKFVQEVCWRTYWKGWLEMRPAIWADYRRDLDRLDRSHAIESAELGQTEIDAFNDWAHELVNTGYLHNHARMWFASIWIFTLGLPWQAGADFFMRHLLDGDPASNTLSWRWVAGLQTKGKHYLARSSNISKFTEGRHNPEWRLNTQAEPLTGPDHPDRRPIRELRRADPNLKTVVLLHDDDLSPGYLSEHGVTESAGVAGLCTCSGRSPNEMAAHVTQFTRAALEDAMSRASRGFGPVGPIISERDKIIAWAAAHSAEQVITPYAPVGPAASALRNLRKDLTHHGIELVEVMRPWDKAAWPHATHGFFRFKSVIPDLIASLTE
ncbi:FAD-binding domain-containing protein [Gymnodinialimonas sp. 2305UL16-5]|uniref:FAD-binding domain-containing protein n=1 Tax=Gymnodinialimonas mytili TaxID=3126503 RepID=UPI0030ACD635